MKLAMDDYQGFHERMSRLREMEICLDGAICADGGEVKVHLPYIAACNLALFNRIIGLIKQGKTELNARNMSLRGIQLLIDYCYTGEILITAENFEHIIDAALGLEFLNVVEQCVQFALGPNINANIWCHFLRAAFKHPRSVQPNNYIPDLILQNINKIPKEALIKGLDAAYIGEILEHGTFDDTQRSYTANAFLEIMLVDKADIKNYRDVIIGLRDKLKLRDKVTLPPDVPVTTIMALLDLTLGIGFHAVVEACSAALEKLPPTADVTSQILKWKKQYADSESEIHLNKVCYHAYRNLPLDITEDDMCLMLGSDYLGQSKEIDIFKTALRWLEHHNASIETNVRIMSLIRFGLMPKSDLDEIAKDFSLSGCEKILFTAWKNTLNPYEQPLAEGDMNRIRLDHPLVYIFGGKDASDNYNRNLLMSEVSLKQGNVSLSPFTEMGQTPIALSDSSCATVNGYVFVSGGVGDSGIVDSLFRFDPRTNTWLELAKMRMKRNHHTLTAMRDTLVAIGGWDGKNPVNSLERYDIGNNAWADIGTLPEARFQHAASYVDLVFYITGGSEEKTLFRLRDEVWDNMSSMLHVRQSHAMTGVSGMLVVAGGIAKHDGDWLDLMSTECYDVIQDQWTELAPPSFTCRRSFSTRIKDWLYIIGGYSGTENTPLDRIQRYNIESNEWEVCQTKLPHKLKNIVGAYISDS